MKAKPLKRDDNVYRQCEPSEATHVKLHVPGPYPYRIIPVIIKGTRDGTPCWTWNGDVDRPTLKPSILTRASEGWPKCHSFVTDGRIQFLPDSGHELAGQTLDLLDVDDE